IIGGYVYRGSEHPDLYGKYIFGDNGSKRLWALTYDAGGNHTVELLMTLPFSSQFYSLSGFGVDGDGELYIMKFNGNNSSGGEIYKLTRQNQGAVEPPTLLSQTGAFSNLNNMQPEDYLIPFELNMPFYSDAAKKYRWFTVPNNGNYASDGTQIDNSANGDWDYPNGSVLVKHFEIQTDENDATSKRKLETRFMIKGDDGKFYGVTYRWNDAQTDATLLTDSRTDTFAIQTSTGPQTLTWYYPSRGECLSCHNEVTGGVLGPKASQLNSDAFYEISGRTANQLKTYMYIDLLENPIDTNNLAGLLTSAPPNSTDFTLEEEVMSYLDANCASCHRPGTGVQADFDAQLSTPLDQKDIVYGAARKDMGKPGSQIVVPGDLEHSVLYQRMKLVHSELAMPPVGKNNVDEYGLTLMENWIMSLDPDFATQGCNNQVNPADMSIHYVDSEETNGENAPASNAIDGDANTYWHTEWQNSSPPPPHDLQINLGAVRSVNQISYLPRAGGANGTIRDYEIYLSMDGSSWGSPVASGTWGGGASERFVSFAAQNASYVRLLALSEINGNNWTSVAEFRVYEGGCNKKGQSIQFADIDHQPASVANISLTATATSTLPVNFEVVSGPATLGANNLLDFTGSEGLVVIRATQDGDSDYNAAEPVERSFRIIPNGSGNGTGLRGEYYNNDDLSDLRFARTDAQIDFYWGAGAPDAGMSGDTYSVLWKGKIESPVSDTVHFVTRTDDGVRLWVNNQLLIDAWQDQSATQHSGKLFMNAGAQVPIRVEFYEKGVYAEASLSWFSNDIPQEIVPQAFLYPDVVFPAELLEFNAVVEDGQVLLDWKTAQEENVSHFTVERSEDGSVFSDLLDVAAVGSSRVVQSYNATDIAPMPGTSYYRLRTIDFDGAFDFSPTVEVTIEDQNLFLQLEAFPNPVGQRGELTVRLKSNEDRSLRVRMVSTTGQTVQELTHQMNGTESQLRLSRKGLSEGIYFLVVEDEAFRKVQRIWLR
ncbi:MAG: discoidin domain-containing protein, partial [Bacteroidota bacterium]